MFDVLKYLALLLTVTFLKCSSTSSCCFIFSSCSSILYSFSFNSFFNFSTSSIISASVSPTVTRTRSPDLNLVTSTLIAPLFLIFLPLQLGVGL